MTTLREAAAAVMEQLKHGWVEESDPVAQDLKAALAEPVQEHNFCPRCGKRSFPDTIHTCTPPQHEIGEQNG